MSDTTGSSAGRDPAPTRADVVHEAYSFACMRCGHLWEQSFEIEHQVNPEGRTVCVYRAEGRRVPSPLTQPACTRCGAHLVRIMRPGRVDNPLLRPYPARPERPSGATPRRTTGPARDQGPDLHDDQPARSKRSSSRGHGHHWHLPAFLHLRRRPGQDA